MATIGTFKKDGNGYAGNIETLTLKAKITFEPANKKSDNSPDFRVFHLANRFSSETGAARKKTSKIRAFLTTVRRPVIYLVAAVVLGTALAAIVILPFGELLKNSSDLTSRPRDVYVQPKFFFASLLPTYFNGAPQSFTIQIAFYAGVLPLMLALIALLRARVERIVIAIFAAGCILVVRD